MSTADVQLGTITLHDVEQILDKMRDRIHSHVQAGRRKCILNERFLHHMFSCEVGKLCEQRAVDLWQSLLLEPEYPTGEKFRRKEIDLRDPDATARNAIGRGKAGSHPLSGRA